jgi:hypothetical protein
MKYSLRKDPNYMMVLQRDGKDMICPMQSALPIPQQNSMGNMTISIVRMPCCMACPHAEYNEEEKVYTISCGQKPKSFEVEELPSNSLKPQVIN